MGVPKALLAAALLAGLTACGSTAPSRFYVLTPAAPVDDGAASDLVVGVELLGLPGSVDRPQMVSAVGPNERMLSEFDRWAEDLGTNVARVVRQNLEQALGSPVYEAPSRWMPPADFKVGLEIVAFDGMPEGLCVLEARWHLVRGSGNWIATHHARFESGAEGDGFAGVAAAMSRNLSDLSDAIARSILGEPGPGAG